MTHTVESLTAFTERIRIAFLAKSIPGPVHLCSSTQAEPLIDIFKNIRPQDWVFSTWRSSFHALLKGIPEADVFAQILEGRSMYLSSREHRFYCSSIVGGILPIALGVAAGIKMMEREFIHKGHDESLAALPKVWVFIGDMTARTGLYHEFCQYASGHDLPIRVIIENNGLSTNANTEQTWGTTPTPSKSRVGRYYYHRNLPHVGIGQKVQF